MVFDPDREVKSRNGGLVLELARNPPEKIADLLEWSQRQLVTTTCAFCGASIEAPAPEGRPPGSAGAAAARPATLTVAPGDTAGYPGFSGGGKWPRTCSRTTP